LHVARWKITLVQTALVREAVKIPVLPKVPYFRIYDLRSTYATRLSAGGVADEWVTQLLRKATRRCSRSIRNEAADETRGAGETHRQANETGLGFAQHRARLNRVLAQYRRGKGESDETSNRSTSLQSAGGLVGAV
jgi:hypothetical protein